MIGTAPHQTAQRANALVDEVWAHIPTDLPTEQALRVAACAFDILSAPTDAEFEAIAARALHLALALGLVATIAYALLHDSRLAWVGAALYTSAAAIYALYLMTTEPNE